MPIRQSRQWRHGRCLEYVGATDHPTTKMQCVRRAIRFVRTLRQQVLAGENVQARKRRRLRQTYDQEMEAFYVSLTIFDRGVQSLRQFYHPRRQINADRACAAICGFGCKSTRPARDIQQTCTGVQMHVVEKRIGGQSSHRRKKCVIALCQGIMTLAFEGPQSFRLAARQFCWRHNHHPPDARPLNNNSSRGAATSWMSGCGPSRHFSCAAEFGRYRRIADSGKPSARQIYGFTA